jgi:hypothetical protein
MPGDIQFAIIDARRGARAGDEHRAVALVLVERDASP